jgi:hypothetical protein
MRLAYIKLHENTLSDDYVIAVDTSVCLMVQNVSTFLLGHHQAKQVLHNTQHWLH